MASFETDLARHLAAYEAAERADEIDRDMMSENTDYAVNGENATLIPDLDVLDPASPAHFVVSASIVRLNPGVDGEFEPYHTTLP